MACDTAHVLQYDSWFTDCLPSHRLLLYNKNQLTQLMNFWLQTHTHTQVHSLAHCKAYIIFQIKECIVCCEEVRGGHLQRDSFHYIKCPWLSPHPAPPPPNQTPCYPLTSPPEIHNHRDRKKGVIQCSSSEFLLRQAAQLHTDGQQWARQGIDWADLTGKIKSSFCSKPLQTTCF